MSAENIKYPVLDKGFIEVYDVYGSDLTVVNSARVSYGKHKDVFEPQDTKLCEYLAEHEHTSPFRTCGMLFHIKCPIFVMRQFIRHRLGVEVNEISGRYVEFEDCEFYTPDYFRKQSESNKQGSEEGIPESFELLSQNYWIDKYTDICKDQFDLYKRMVDAGIAKEMARMHLPLSLYTEYVTFMSLQAIGHFCRLREDKHAQKEIQEYAYMMDTITTKYFPESFNALMKGMP